MIPPPDVLALIGVVAIGGGVAVLLFQLWVQRRDSAEKEGKQE